jgi:UDP-N-acetylmuramate--alanine ligase
MGKISKTVNKRIHFIGVGGIGMSGIAQLCLKQGYSVSGSDINESDNTRKLAGLGADIYIGHSRNNVDGQDLVVYSSAIKDSNCELKEAIKKQIPIMQRAKLLASLMNNQTVITVAGAHGKTTTSSLVAHFLTEVGLSPTIAVGGIVGNISNNAKLGLGKYFIAEADESDGTFLFYKSNYSIITNIDIEHLDFYKKFENIKKAFRKYIMNNHKNGCIFWCFADEEIKKIIRNSNRRNISFGFDKNSDIYASNIKLGNFKSQFDVFFKNKFIDTFQLCIPGKHNISNSLAVIGLGIELGIGLGKIKSALGSFVGVKRRFQVKYNENDILIVDDYAHHPTEIMATIDTAKRFDKKRFIVIFQPHRYSRMKHLLEKFSQSFFDVDYLFLTDIYAAGEKKIKGVSSDSLYKLIRKLGKPHTDFIPKDRLIERVSGFVQKGDLVLFLGAGDITKICDGFVEEIKRKDKI